MNKRGLATKSLRENCGKTGLLTCDAHLGGAKVVTITINKWDEFNPRKDRAKHSWIRLNNDIGFSESLFELDFEQKWFWICLLTFASKKQSATFDINLDYFEKTHGFSKKKISSALNILSHGGVVSVTERLPSGDRAVAVGITTYERTYVTNERTNDTVAAVAKIAPPENSPESLLNFIPQETRDRWLTLYRDEVFLKRELIKAHGYYVTDNPSKCPKSVKGWCRALSMWFERAWTWQAKTPKANHRRA